MATTTYTVFDGEILAENRAGTKSDYVPDPLGSTRALLDDVQSQTDTWTYWPYGEVQSRTGLTDTPFTFDGVIGYYSGGSGGTYVRARWYLDSLSAWRTVDRYWPMQPPYRYARSNPILIIDPSGNFFHSDIHIGPILLDIDIDQFFPNLGKSISGFLEKASNKAIDYCGRKCYRCLRGLYDDLLKEYPNGVGRDNAIRHCVGACLAVKKCGKKCSRLIIFHEANPFTEDSKIDRCNNDWGFEIGEAGLNCRAACTWFWENGDLCREAKPVGNP